MVIFTCVILTVILGLSTNVNVESSKKKVEKQTTEDELWGSTTIQSHSQFSTDCSNRQQPAKRSTMTEVEQGWGDWNEGGKEGTYTICIIK